MELFQDISNQQPKQQPVLKTFERRRRVATIQEEPPSVDADAASPSSSSSSSCTDNDSPQDDFHAAEAPGTAAGALSKRGRHSSVLRGAALPGHQLFSSSVQASRSLLLAKMSKAKRKAYLAYTQQMAEYYAEVDKFELVVESPTAATDKKTRSKLATGSAAGTKPTPLVWEQLQRHSRGTAATAGATPASHADSPASALLSATPAFVAPSHVSEEPDASLRASPVSPQLPAAAAAAAAAEGDGGLAAATPAPASTRPAAAGAATVAAEAGQSQSPAASSELPEVTPLQASIQRLRSAGAAAAGSSGASSPLQANYLDLMPSISTSLGGLSLASAMPAGQQAKGTQASGASGTSAPGAGAGLFADTPVGASGLPQELQGSAAASAGSGVQQQGESASAAAGLRSSRLSTFSSSSDASLASTTPAVSQQKVAQQQQQQQQAEQEEAVGLAVQQRSRLSSCSEASLASVTPAVSQRTSAAQQAQAQQAQQKDAAMSAQQQPSRLSSCSHDSLASVTPAATQQSDMQQLMQQMQDMLTAVTPEPSSQLQQQQQQQQQEEERQQQVQDEVSADVPAVEAVSKRQQRNQKQKQQQKPGRKKQGAAKATAAARADADAVSEDLQQQQQEQQQLAEQHYLAWLQKQAEEAATAELEALELAATADAELTPLQQMLKACGQSVCVQNIPQMCDFLADVVDLRDVVKIGEGTYGEAFKSGQVVLKFVPMEGANLINGWPQKGAGDLLGEAVIARALTELQQDRDDTGALHSSYTDAFVQTHRVGVCRGPYPAAFIKAWKAWDKRNKSENDFIGGLPDEQLYAVFAMANCGRDLESYQLQGYEQVRSMMLQTALALAVAEEALAFEHRDLHWGNIMLSPPQDTHVTARLKGCTIRVRAEGARVRLIDFTASRLQTPGGDVVFCDLELEDGLFDGPKGKPQFETYRRMRKLTRKDWTGSHPGTNVLWLLYLTELLLSSEKPIPGATAAQKRCMREFKKRLGGYSNCSEVIWDELFEGLWATA